MILKVTSQIALWGRLLFLKLIGCSRSLLPDRKNPQKFLYCTAFLTFLPIQQSIALEFHSDTVVATAGYYQLRWSGNEENFQLQESNSRAFTSYKIIYEGKDLSRVISGKPNGDYFYRLIGKNEGNVPSDIVQVTVKHHSLKNAFLFFLLGAFVFISTLVLIFKGNKRES